MEKQLTSHLLDNTFHMSRPSRKTINISDAKSDPL